MITLVSILAVALANRNPVPLFGRDWEVTDLRLKIMSNGEIDGEIIMLDKGSDNHNRIVIEILMKGDKDGQEGNGSDDAKDA